jgi:hypothetical protein
MVSMYYPFKNKFIISRHLDILYVCVRGETLNYNMYRTYRHVTNLDKTREKFQGGRGRFAVITNLRLVAGINESRKTGHCRSSLEKINIFGIICLFVF